MSNNNVDDIMLEYGGYMSQQVEATDDDKAFHEAKAKLNTLIEQRVVEARIDELVHLVDSGSDTTWKAKEWFSVSERLKQLRAQQDKEQDD